MSQTESFAKAGVTVANGVRELAATVDVVLSCLTNDEAVQSVYSGPEGIFAGARPEAIVLEMSTISPESSRAVHRLGAKSRIEVLDVAISGSTPAARARHADTSGRRQ